MADDKQDLAELPKQTPGNPVNSPQALAALLGGGEYPFYTSIDVATDPGKVMLFKVSQAADHELADCIDRVIQLQHVYAAAAEKNGEVPGEVIQMTRIVLIDADGVSYQCFSKGIRKVLNLIAGTYGLPPWKTPIPVQVKREKVANGHQWFTLIPAPRTDKGGKK